MSRKLAMVLAAGSVVGLAGGVQAQIIDWNNAGGGSWQVAGNWVGGNEPDNAAESARFALGGTYTVDLNAGRNIADLLLLDGGAVLRVNNSTFLTFTNAVNHGAITVNPGAGGGATALNIASGGGVSGAGEILLNASSGFLDRAYIATNPSGGSWTHGAGHLIHGRGNVYYGLTNNGTIRADQAANTLQVLNGTIVNNGAMQATNGGVLQLSGETVSQAGGGSISASGADSVVQLAGANTVNQGAMSAGGGGLIAVVSGGSTVNGVTISGPFNINNSTTLTSVGGLTQSGVLTVNPQGGGSTTALTVAAGTSLGGTGTVTLNATSGILDRAQLYSPTQVAWTHAAGHTVNGRGNIYYSLVNNGTITATFAGETLQLLNGTVTNNATLQTAGGGLLQFSSETVNQSSSGVIAATSGNVSLLASTIAGGTLTTGAGMRIASVAGTQTLNGVTINGTFDINNGTSVASVGGLTHSGVLTVNPQGGGSVTALTVAAGTSLGGTGTVTLNATSGFLDRAQLYSPTQVAWTHAAGHTINGRGNIYYSLVNNGTITATFAGETLQLLNGTVTNNATLQTAGGGLLQFSSETVNQSSSGVIAATSGNVSLLASTITGGSLTSGAGMRIAGVAGTQHLGGVVNSATFDVNNGTSVECDSTVTNNAVITVNAQGGGGATSFKVANGQTLGGTGSVVLNATSGFLDRAYLAPVSGSWTHGAGHTIRGRGNVYSVWTNNGTVVADAAGEILQLRDGVMTNNGTLRTAGGFLDLTSETVSQGANGVISANSGTVRINSSTISGGRMSTGGAKFASTSGTTTLTGGVVLASDFDVNNSTTVSLPSGLTNHGTMLVNAQAGGGATPVLMGAGGALSGTGSLVLNASSGFFDRAYVSCPTGSMSNGHGHTIAGTGNVYATWTNHGTVKPSGPSRRIDCQQGPFTQASDGTYHVEMAGLTPGTYGVLAGPQPKVLAGTLRVTLANGYVPSPCDAITIITGPVSGAFTSYDFPALPLGGMHAVYNANSVVVSYIPADFNGDGFPDFFDYDDFVAAYELGTPEADFNHDGFLDFFDYDAFIEAFESGC